MHQLLVVDDLPIIANGLAGFFGGTQHLDLEVHTAYSAETALSVLNRRQIGIVLSDIKMPGMNGIELLGEIRSRWPDCKIIFLTAYDDFEYVKKALSLGSFEYILKVEGHPAVLSAVERAIAKLDEERADRGRLEKAERHMKLALPLLQKELTWELLQGEKVDAPVLADRLASMEMPLRQDRPVYMTIGRIDWWREGVQGSDKTLRIYKLQNTAEEYFSDGFHTLSVIYERSKIVWLLQQKDVDEPDASIHAPGRIESLLEAIREKCGQSWDLPVSFGFNGMEIEWTDLAVGFNLHKFLLFRARQAEAGAPPESPVLEGEDICKVRIGQMYDCLQQGGEEQFYKLYEDTFRVFADPAVMMIKKIEIYHLISAMILSLLYQKEELCGLAEEINLLKIDYNDEMESWERFGHDFLLLAFRIIEIMKSREEENVHEIVRKTHQYIENQLATDISLNKLAEYVHLSPHYLSRVYRQITGITLSDYISEYRKMRSKELLKKSGLKVQDIAAALGYNSSLAFIRFFKKHNRMTPQEYRILYARQGG